MGREQGQGARAVVRLRDDDGLGKHVGAESDTSKQIQAIIKQDSFKNRGKQKGASQCIVLNMEGGLAASHFIERE